MFLKVSHALRLKHCHPASNEALIWILQNLFCCDGFGVLSLRFVKPVYNSAYRSQRSKYLPYSKVLTEMCVYIMCYQVAADLG